MRETKGQTGIKPIDMKNTVAREEYGGKKKAQKDNAERSIEIQM